MYLRNMLAEYSGLYFRSYKHMFEKKYNPSILKRMWKTF